MATITGTTGTDNLTGTTGNDLFQTLGTDVVGEADVLVGLDGADVYDVSGGHYRSYVIDDRGTDGATDAIVNAGPMHQSTSFGYQSWVAAERVGDDLVIHLPSRPYRFRKPARPPYDIHIVDQFADTGVKTLQAGGVEYRLSTGDLGTSLADIMAGGVLGDDFNARGGDDFVFGNGGNDVLRLGSGNDVGFGGTGDDRILLGGGDDRAYGGDGNDTIIGHGGQDSLAGDAGNDVLRGGGGFDMISGGDGNDLLVGGKGNDRLSGGYGNDRLVGNAGADIYVISAYGDAGESGHDRITEKGTAGTWSSHDVIDLGGIYGPAGGSIAETFAALSFARVGKDMVMLVKGGDGADVTVKNMLDAAHHDQFFVEELSINGGYWTPITLMFLDGAVADIGDDRSIFMTYGAKMNEILFGTGGNDRIFGGTGTNFIWTGDGADTLIYKVGDGESLGSYGGRISNDIVEDFDVTRDRMDFTEVAKDIGASFADLVISADAEGDAVVYLDTGNWEVADISIELRGVTAAEVTADLFVF